MSATPSKTAKRKRAAKGKPAKRKARPERAPVKRKGPIKAKGAKKKRPQRNPKPPPPRKKGDRTASKSTRMEAKLHAADQLARAQSMIKVQRALQGKPWKLHASTARAVVLEVLRDWELQDREEIQKARVRQFHRVYRLYDRAFELEQLNVCARLEKLLADLEGTWPSKEDGADTAGHGVDDEFEKRNPADLDFYTDKGYWPEEAPTGLPN